MNDTEYKFKLIDYSRDILAIAGYGGTQDKFEKKIFDLAEKIDTWIKKDLNNEVK